MKKKDRIKPTRNAQKVCLPGSSKINRNCLTRKRLNGLDIREKSPWITICHFHWIWPSSLFLDLAHPKDVQDCVCRHAEIPLLWYSPKIKVQLHPHLGVDFRAPANWDSIRGTWCASPFFWTTNKHPGILTWTRASTICLGHFANFIKRISMRQNNN